MGLYLFDGATAVRAKQASPTGANLGTTGVLPEAPHLWNGVSSTYSPQHAVNTVGDGVAGANTSSTGGYRFNETTWDRERNNTEGTLLASAARTATATSATLTNHNARGGVLVLNVTAASGTGGLQVRVLGTVMGLNYYANAAPIAITATGVYAYEVYPGASSAGVASGAHVQQRTAGVLPRSWIGQVLHGDGSSYTYTLAYALLV